jgi:hypothetical protein
MNFNSPDIVTNIKQYANPPTTDPGADSLQASMARQVVAQYIPIYEPAVQGSAPNPRYYRGWYAPFIPTTAGPTYPYPTQAPNILYQPKSYGKLIAAAANPASRPNRSGIQLTAPGINQGL